MLTPNNSAFPYPSANEQPRWRSGGLPFAGRDPLQHENGPNAMPSQTIAGGPNAMPSQTSTGGPNTMPSQTIAGGPNTMPSQTNIGGPTFAGHNVAPYEGCSNFVGPGPVNDEGNPARMHQDDTSTHSGTTNIDALSFIRALAYPTPSPDNAPHAHESLSIFVGRICLHLFNASDVRKRDVLVSADTVANAELAALVFARETYLQRPMREQIIANFKQSIQMMLYAFGQWQRSWNAAAADNIPGGERMQALSYEGALRNPQGWMRALIFVFGGIPELWGFQTSWEDPEVSPQSPSAFPRHEKGKAIDRSNAPDTTLEAVPFDPMLMLGESTPYMNAFQAPPTTDPSFPAMPAVGTAMGAAQSQPQFGWGPFPGVYPPQAPSSPRFMYARAGGSPPSFLGAPTYGAFPTPAPGAPAYPTPVPGAPVYGTPTPTFFPGPSSSNAYPSAKATTSRPPQPTPSDQTTEGRENSPQRSSSFPLTIRIPEQPSSSRTDTAAGSVLRPPVRVKAFDLTMLAQALGTPNAVTLPGDTNDFDQATGHLLWSRSTQSLASTSGAGKSRSSRDWRSLKEQWDELVQQYKEIKDIQISKLDEAARWLRQWHALYMELEYRLDLWGIQPPPGYRVQAGRLLTFANLLSLIVLYRREQLSRFP